MNQTNANEPYGAKALFIKSIKSAHLIDMYQKKCGLDVSRFFPDLQEVSLYECTATGMRFWRPISLAGDEAFYCEISQKWPDYYKTDRWEYTTARSAIGKTKKKVLEIGCGRGFFLRSLEPIGHAALGLELSNGAIANKVTCYDIRNQSLEMVADHEPESFDVACSFQVLEHVIDPAALIRNCVRVIKPGGIIIFSTPNYEYPVHQNCEDPFDMPPHHLNHFTNATYRRIATLVGLELLYVRVQRIISPKAEVHINDRHSWPNRILRKSINLALRTIKGVNSQIGHTLLAVYRKQTSH